MTNTILLKKLIDESGLKRNFIAKELGLTPYGLKLKTIGKNKFYAEEISKMCELLGIDDLDLKERIFFAHNVEYNSTQ